MQERELAELLGKIQAGECSVEDGLEKLRHLPFEDLGFAKLDHHRLMRKGFPEVIFGGGKSAEQIVALSERLRARECPVLITRMDAQKSESLRARFPGVCYHEQARCAVIEEPGFPRAAGEILVLTAGTSDIPVAEEAAITAELMVNSVQRIFDVGVAGLHRLLSHEEYLTRADVIIAVAGMEGALPSVVSGLVSVPVIGVPTSVGYGTSSGGVAALLGMLNSCASGLAVVNIDNGFGAGYMASSICRSMVGRRPADVPPQA